MEQLQLIKLDIEPHSEPHVTIAPICTFSSAIITAQVIWDALRPVLKMMALPKEEVSRLLSKAVKEMTEAPIYASSDKKITGWFRIEDDDDCMYQLQLINIDIRRQ